MQGCFPRLLILAALVLALMGGATALVIGAHTPDARAAQAHLVAADSNTNTPTMTATATTGSTNTATATTTNTPAATNTATGTATNSPVPATGTATTTATTTAAVPTTTGTPPTATATLTPVPPGAATSDYFAEGYTGTAAVNGRASFTEAINVLNPSSSTATVTFTYYIEGQSAPQVVTKSVAARSVLRESVNTDVGNDKLVATVVTSPQRVYATRTMSRKAPDNSRLDGSTTSPVTAPATSWGFPEGYTGVTFQEYLTVLNPSGTNANVTVLLAPQAASAAGARTLHFTVPALSRATENIRSLNEGAAAKSVGMIVTSDVPIVAERVLYFGAGAGSGKFGSTVRSGIATPGTSLHFGYGSSLGDTGSGATLNPLGDQDFITLLNPNPSGAAAQVAAVFYNSSGQQIGQPTIVNVAPQTRQTIIANVVLGSAPVTPFSVSISSNVAIMAESAQYYGGSPNIGQHPGVDFQAVSAASTDVFMTDLGTTLPDTTPVDRSIFLYNPGATPIQISATYFSSTGATATQSYTVPAGGIFQTDVGSDTQNTIPPGPVAGEFKLTSGGGGFAAYAVGLTSDFLSATEDVGIDAY